MTVPGRDLARGALVDLDTHGQVLVGVRRVGVCRSRAGAVAVGTDQHGLTLDLDGVDEDAGVGLARSGRLVGPGGGHRTAGAQVGTALDLEGHLDERVGGVLPADLVAGQEPEPQAVDVHRSARRCR